MAEEFTEADRKEIEQIKLTLRTLIAWLPQVAGSPISVRDAEALLVTLDKK